MTNLTRLQVRDLVKATIGELDYSKLKPLLVNQIINTEQRNVQKDLMPIIGMKSFVKEAVNSGYIFEQPTDLMSIPNSIIDLKCSAGTYSTIGFNFPNPVPAYNFVFTSIEPATVLTGWTVETTAGTTAGVTVNVSTKKITLTIDAGTTKISDILAVWNTSILYSSLFTISSITDPTTAIDVIGTGTTTITNGTGGGWNMATETSLEDFSRVSDNIYIAPSTTEPVFVRKGNSSAVRLIEILPNTITYSLMQYYYVCPDLSADTSYLTIPTDYEDLVITKVQEKCYELLLKQTELAGKQVEYATKIKEYQSNYINSLNSIKAEKTRLQSNDN